MRSGTKSTGAPEPHSPQRRFLCLLLRQRTCPSTYPALPVPPSAAVPPSPPPPWPEVKNVKNQHTDTKECISRRPLQDFYKDAAGKEQKNEVSPVLGEVLGESEIKKERRERLSTQRQYRLGGHVIM